MEAGSSWRKQYNIAWLSQRSGKQHCLLHRPAAHDSLWRIILF
jgi:hypothetical protein